MTSEPRRELERIFRAALAAVEPGKLTAVAFEQFANEIAAAGRVFVLAIGKAARAMAAELERRLGARVAGGLIDAPPAHADLSGTRLRVFGGGHPLPDANSERAGLEALTILRDARPDDVMMVALSGGASAMFVAPAHGITLEDKIAVTSAMLRAGANIRELNTIRKHLSAVKGGRLALAANGARVITLILSDVPGNDVATIGSGLAAADLTTFSDAVSILKRRDVWGRAPERVRDLLERGVAGEIPDTPKRGDGRLVRVTNLIVGDNSTAVEAAASAAREDGYDVEIWRGLDGEADDVGRTLAAHLASIRRPRTCVIAGGEPVVTVKGRGQGGRAQQCALSLAIELGRSEQAPRVAALIAGTDGIDGPTDAAGAFVTSETTARAAALGLDPSAARTRNDAYNFFKATNDLLTTGPTGTNVADLAIALVND